MVENNNKESMYHMMDNSINHTQNLETRNNYSNSNSQICCLISNGTRCLRLSGNASCSKRIQRTMMQRKLKLSIDENARHIYICDYHKNIIQSMRSITKRKRKEDDEDNNSNDEYSSYNNTNNVNNYDYDDLPQVNLSGLQVNTLRRCKRFLRVATKPGLNKSQLAECLENHFKSIPVVEKEAITFFIYMVKNNRNKLDSNKNITI